MKKLLTATALMAILATPAMAVTMTIGYERPDLTPGTITTVAQSVDPINGTLTVNFGSGDWTVSANEWAGATTILTGSVGAFLPFPYSGEAISVYLSLSNITSPIGVPVLFQNTLTFDFPAGAGWYVNGTTYIDDATAGDGGNKIFSLANYLTSPQIWTAPGTYQLNAWYTPNAAGPYSITQFYGFQAADPPSPVPGPVVGSGLSSLLMAGLFAFWRRRREMRPAALAAWASTGRWQRDPVSH